MPGFSGITHSCPCAAEGPLSSLTRVMGLWLSGSPKTKLTQFEKRIFWDMESKIYACLYHIGLKNVRPSDGFFAFFILNIQVSSSLGDFTVSHSMASSQDSGNLITTRKAKGRAATLLTWAFSICLLYLQKTNKCQGQERQELSSPQPHLCEKLEPGPRAEK